MSRKLLVLITTVSLLFQSFSYADEGKNKNALSANPIRDAAITVGALGLFVIIPGVFLVVGTVSTVLKCGTTVVQLKPNDVSSLVDYFQFDRSQAAQAFRLTCSQNSAQESVFVPYMRAHNIQQKMLYTRLSPFEKCVQIKRDSDENPLKIDFLIAEEAVESKSLQEKIYEKVFDEKKLHVTQPLLLKLKDRLNLRF